GGDRTGSPVAGAGAVAGRRTSHAAAATVGQRTRRPQAFGAPRHPVERRAHDPLPSKASRAAKATRVDLRRQWLDGALLEAADDLRPRDRTARGSRGLRL